MSPGALDLVQSLLEYNPIKRITAADALQAPFFTTEGPEMVPPVEYVISLPLDRIVILLTLPGYFLPQLGVFGRRMARVRVEERERKGARESEED